MNVQRIAITCAVVLVVAGCIIAAGCTSASSATEDPFAGIWFSNYTTEDGNQAQATLLITDDGNGLCHIVHGNATDMMKLTWKRTGDGVYAIAYANGYSRTFTMNTEKDTITSTTGAVIRKISATEDPFAGFWFSNYTTEDGNQAQATLLVTDDGKGICHIAYDNGTSTTELTWKRTDDGVYAIAYANGYSRTFTMNTEKDTITSTTGAVIRKISATEIM